MLCFSTSSYCCCCYVVCRFFFAFFFLQNLFLFICQCPNAVLSLLCPSTPFLYLFHFYFILFQFHLQALIFTSTYTHTYICMHVVGYVRNFAKQRIKVWSLRNLKLFFWVEKITTHVIKVCRNYSEIITIAFVTYLHQWSFVWYMLTEYWMGYDGNRAVNISWCVIYMVSKINSPLRITISLWCLVGHQVDKLI